MNTDAPPLEWPTRGQAERRVREIQAKLHRWAGEDSGRRFRDVFNLVHDPAFLLVAWHRVRGNRVPGRLVWTEPAPSTSSSVTECRPFWLTSDSR